MRWERHRVAHELMVFLINLAMTPCVGGYAMKWEQLFYEGLGRSGTGYKCANESSPTSTTTTLSMAKRKGKHMSKISMLWFKKIIIHNIRQQYENILCIIILKKNWVFGNVLKISKGGRGIQRNFKTDGANKLYVVNLKAKTLQVTLWIQKKPCGQEQQSNRRN